MLKIAYLFSINIATVFMIVKRKLWSRLLLWSRSI